MIEVQDQREKVEKKMLRQIGVRKFGFYLGEGSLDFIQILGKGK